MMMEATRAHQAYRLVGHTPQACALVEALAAMNDPARLIARTDLGECLISTMFLVFRARGDVGAEPALFETIVLDIDQRIVARARCIRYVDAQRQHAEAVRGMRRSAGSMRAALNDAMRRAA